MKSIIVFLSLFPYLLFANDFCSHKNHSGKTHYKTSIEDKRSDTIDVLHYDLDLDFTLASTDLFKANCEVKFQAKMPISSISLDLLSLTVDSVKHTSGSLSFSYNDTLLVISFPALSIDEVDSVTIYYHGSPVQDASGLGGYYNSGSYFFNLGVGIEGIPHSYGRVWHPCFDNLVERATYSFDVLTNSGKTAYCNGSRTSVTPVGVDSLITSWTLAKEIPTYLAAFAISDYTHVELNYFSSLQGITIPVWLISKEGDTTNFKASFINLFSALEKYEENFGPYVWEKIGFSAVPFSSGALEHATMVAYPLITINGATTYEGLMAHELAHSWWGNWVTTASPEEMWVNEGMATYCEVLFQEWIYDYEAYLAQYRDYHYDALRDAHLNDNGHYALDAMPLEHTYGTHTYIKGADMVHTLRSYLGDSNFFTALKSIQTTFGGGNMSTIEMRDHINSLGIGDVTDYFSDWISQPGYTHYAVIRFDSEVISGGYSVDVLIDQKLRFANHFAENVPLQVTFMDENWNLYEETITFSGDFAIHNFTVPFNPSFVALNLNEQISDATTAVTEIVSTTGTKLYNYANIRVTTTSISDSALFRIEHNWVYPDANGLMDNVVLSSNRYWNIHGVNLNNVEGEMRIEYNGGIGNLDNELMQDLGGQPFIEDSLVLLYRPNADADWQIHPDYDQSFTGSHTDKFGFFDVNIFLPGQYAFGYRTNSVGLNSTILEKGIKIYPNPSTDIINIDLTNHPNKLLNIEIRDIQGKLLQNLQFKGGSIESISIESFMPGNYFVYIKDEHFTVASHKIIKL